MAGSGGLNGAQLEAMLPEAEWLSTPSHEPSSWFCRIEGKAAKVSWSLALTCVLIPVRMKFKFSSLGLWLVGQINHKEAFYD